MICPTCGKETPAARGRCASCNALVTVLPPTGAGVPPPAPDTRGQPFVQAATTFSGAEAVHTAGFAGDDSAWRPVTTGMPESTDGTAQSGGRGPGPLSCGQAFGPRYHIIKLLGAGGMGAVYQAWDGELGVAVALKVIRVERGHGSASSDAEKRFKKELLLARQVTHKNVVRIHDLGEIDGIKYITMPYVEGDDLAMVLRREGKLTVARALLLARQIAAGLEAAHEAGVVHRDLKPPNVMIGTGGDDVQALIMDFGISASSADAASGGIIGTLEYMAPEQAAGGMVDARADIYAFGVMLYEMLVGPRPESVRTAQDRIAAMRQRCEQGFASVRTIDESIAAPLDALVTRCLERDPADRYQTTAELSRALGAVDDTGELIPVPARVSRRVLAASAVLVLLLLGGTYIVGRRAVPAAPPKHDPVPVLIADFDNRSGEPVFEGTVEQTLALALEGAPYISVFRTRDARRIAAQLAPGTGDRITEDVGQLIARREGLKILLAGAIEKRPAGYRLTLRATDPATGKSIAAASQDFKDQGEVLKAIASMASKVREALGESKTEMARLAEAETFTAGSLDAMSAYARGQELSRANRIPEALEAYQKAVTLDPKFGRAYAGMGSIYSNYFKQPEKAEANYQTAMKFLDRMTDREKYRTLGTYYLNVVRNYEKAVENYETLVRLYPADDVGHGNLALAYLLVGNLPRAVAEERLALTIYPRNSLQRYNYAMYSMYAGDFPTAAAEASRLLKENPSFEVPLLPLALSRLAQGDEPGSRDAYAQLGSRGQQGASLATLGRADLQMYFGHNREAVTVLREGIAADRKYGDLPAVGHKDAALAEAYLALGDRRRAVEAATEAVKLSRRESTLFPAARVLLRSEQEDAAKKISADLENMLQRHTTAYARLISGEIASEHGRTGEAIEALRDGQKRQDSWFSRFLLGKAYVEAGHFVEAIAELELCVKRRGETTDVFFYDMPTLRYLPPVYYWIGRAQEGLHVAAEARKSYEQFLSLRGDADPPDPLAVDARKRMLDQPPTIH